MPCRPRTFRESRRTSSGRIAWCWPWSGPTKRRILRAGWCCSGHLRLNPQAKRAKDAEAPSRTTRRRLQRPWLCAGVLPKLPGQHPSQSVLIEPKTFRALLPCASSVYSVPPWLVPSQPAGLCPFSPTASASECLSLLRPRSGDLRPTEEGAAPDLATNRSAVMPALHRVPVSSDHIGCEKSGSQY